MMVKLEEHTVLPPTDEAAASLADVAAALSAPGKVKMLSAGGSPIALPDEVAQALRDVVAAMTGGQAITIASRDTVLTTQAAADILAISRPTLVRLLEAGQIPYDQPGRHRRIRLVDLIAYQTRTRQSRREVLDAMTQEAAEDDAYKSTAGFVTTR